MNTADLFAANSIVWPLVVLLMFLLVLKDVRPIVTNMTKGLASQAQSNAVAFAIVIGFGLSSSLSAMIDLFKQLDAQTFRGMSVHQYLGLWCQILNPFIVTVIAKVTANPFEKTKPPANPPTP